MSDKVVLDSSAIAALFFKEESSDKVEGVVRGCSEYHTVDQAYSEVASVAWKRVKIYGEDEEIVRQALESAIEFIDKVCKVVDGRSILNQAFELAVEQGITVYDALFVALAVKLGKKLLTTDVKLYKRIRDTSLGEFVKCIR